MGIYNNGSIFGIRIYKINNDDYADILFEQTYNKIISEEQKKEAYLFYTELNDKNAIFFEIYSECSSTYDRNNNEKFMMWYPITLNIFLETFGV
jgi:hypothetical protein